MAASGSGHPVRAATLDRLPDGYAEEIRWGMISYEVPLAVQPDTYNGKPLMYAAFVDLYHRSRRR